MDLDGKAQAGELFSKGSAMEIARYWEEAFEVLLESVEEKEEKPKVEGVEVKKEVEKKEKVNGVIEVAKFEDGDVKVEHKEVPESSTPMADDSEKESDEEPKSEVDAKAEEDVKAE